MLPLLLLLWLLPVLLHLPCRSRQAEQTSEGVCALDGYQMTPLLC
jgi:hypothetical protein